MLGERVSPAEMLRQLEASDPERVATAKLSFEYSLVLGLDAAIVEACWDLGIDIIEKQVTGLFNKTLYLKLTGKAGNLAKLVRWLNTQVTD